MNWLFYPCSTVLRSLLLPNESQSDTSPKWIGPLATSFYRFGGAPSHRTPAASGGARSPWRRRQYTAVAPTLGGGARSRRPHTRTLSCVGACSLLCFSSPPNQQEINGSNRMSFHRANPNKHLCDMSKSKETVCCSFSSKPQLCGLQFHLVEYQIHLTGCIFPQIWASRHSFLPCFHATNSRKPPSLMQLHSTSGSSTLLCKDA